MIETSPTLLEKVRDRSDHASWQRLVTVYKPVLAGWLRRDRRQQFSVRARPDGAQVELKSARCRPMLNVNRVKRRIGTADLKQRT